MEFAFARTYLIDFQDEKAYDVGSTSIIGVWLVTEVGRNGWCKLLQYTKKTENHTYRFLEEHFRTQEHEKPGTNTKQSEYNFQQDVYMPGLEFMKGMILEFHPVYTCPEKNDRSIYRVMRYHRYSLIMGDAFLFMRNSSKWYRCVVVDFQPSLLK